MSEENNKRKKIEKVISDIERARSCFKQYKAKTAEWSN